MSVYSGVKFIREFLRPCSALERSITKLAFGRLLKRLYSARVRAEYWKNCYYILQNKYEGTEVPIKEDYWNLEEKEG